MGHHAQFSVVFRTTGGPEIGFGHLRRSLTLATHLTEEGAQVKFVLASTHGEDVLTAAGFSVTVEAAPDRLGQTFALLERVPSPRVCVLDDPYVFPDELAPLRERAPLACLDDTCERLLPADLLVNGSAGAEELPYRKVSTTRYLLGPQYVLLRKEFASEPDRLRVSKEVRRVLVLTGGGEVGTLPKAIALAVIRVLPRTTVDVVRGPFATQLDFAGVHADRVHLHQCPDDVRSLMLRADLAVSGVGQTAYELAATATPALGLRLAADQAVNARGLARAGVLWDLGAVHESGFYERLAEALLQIAGDEQARHAMAVVGRQLVDGRGAERVAAELRSLALSDLCRV